MKKIMLFSFIALFLISGTAFAEKLGDMALTSYSNSLGNKISAKIGKTMSSKKNTSSVNKNKKNKKTTDHRTLLKYELEGKKMYTRCNLIPFGNKIMY